VSTGEFETKDSGKRVQFDSGMQRDVTDGKTLWHLVASGPMLKRWAGLLTRGAIKYDADNWMKASGEAEAKRFKESAFRHFMQWYYGGYDEDHAAAVIFNVNGFEYVNERVKTVRIGEVGGFVDASFKVPEVGGLAEYLRAKSPGEAYLSFDHPPAPVVGNYGGTD
jgi:hypothetical protein